MNKLLQRICESKDITVFKRLISVLSEWSDKFPMTGIDTMLEKAMAGGKAILPSDRRALDILDYILREPGNFASAVSALLNKRFCDLPQHLKPLTKVNNELKLAFWNCNGKISDMVKDLIDFSGNGKKGYFCDVNGDRVKLYDISVEEISEMNESVNEQEERRKIIARGIIDKADAERIAASKRGKVVSDETDPKKYMVIIQEAVETLRDEENEFFLETDIVINDGNNTGHVNEVVYYRIGIEYRSYGIKNIEVRISRPIEFRYNGRDYTLEPEDVKIVFERGYRYAINELIVDMENGQIREATAVFDYLVP